MKTVKELEKEGKYIYRHKWTVFGGNTTTPTPQRKSEYIDEKDRIFSSKEEFTVWYKDFIAGLAQLDECLNYCKHFVRIKGNDGNYIRNGIEYPYPIDGRWCGTHDYGRGESGKFFDWVISNFGKNWYELMDKYK